MVTCLPNRLTLPFGKSPEFVRIVISLENHSRLRFLEDELLAQQIRFDFSMIASLVVISAVPATWYLASRTSNILQCISFPLNLRIAFSPLWIDKSSAPLIVHTWCTAGSQANKRIAGAVRAIAIRLAFKFPYREMCGPSLNLARPTEKVLNILPCVGG